MGRSGGGETGDKIEEGEDDSKTGTLLLRNFNKVKLRFVPSVETPTSDGRLSAGTGVFFFRLPDLLF